MAVPDHLADAQTHTQTAPSVSIAGPDTPPAEMMSRTSESAAVPPPNRAYSPSRPPTSAEIDAVIAAAIANAPPAPNPPELDRSSTPLMTNLLPSAVGVDGRVNLFVGNLPYRVRWQDVKDLFRKAGTVLRADVSLGPDNRSRGYGTVLMGSREDAARAIDRFNGFTWQTRTLEVRPDRLPPEYEPQAHAPHGPHASGRQQMFGYNLPGGGGHPFPLPGVAPGANWASRPPVPSNLNGPGPAFAYPGHGHAPGGIPRPTSPGGSFASGAAATSSGAAPTLQPFSLGAGAPVTAPDVVAAVRRDSLSPFVHTASSTPGQHRTTSPIIAAGTPRPSSVSDRTSPHRSDPHVTGRGSISAASHIAFGGPKGLQSPTTSGPGSDAGHSHSATPPISNKTVPPVISMEGLSHQGAHMGPPSTLHDRVVFASNLPLHMQWQELKDLLRPAGVIIRADVATDGEGRPRGFGTALFATENDALAAVTMFNEAEIGGRRIRVSLERDSIQESFSRRGSAAVSPGFQDSTTPSSETHSSSGESAIATRLPWGLNTAVNDEQNARGNQHQHQQHQQHRQHQQQHPHPHQHQQHHSGPIPHRQHHPGPIAMPSFAPLDLPGGGGNMLSPLQTRGLPPMTPSMPGFVFNAYPDTPPPGHHHGFASSSGPFSPGIPVTSPTAFQYNPYLNPAPGAPVNRFPNQGGSAALETPTTQTFPGNPVHGPAPGAPGQGVGPSIAGQIGEYFPSVNNRSPLGKGDAQSNDPAAAENPSPATDKTEKEKDADGLVDGTQNLSLDAKDGEVSPTTSTSTPSAPDSTVGGGRASFDLTRHKLGVWELNSGERRASFGDIVAGRNKESQH